MYNGRTDDSYDDDDDEDNDDNGDVLTQTFLPDNPRSLQGEEGEGPDSREGWYDGKNSINLKSWTLTRKTFCVQDFTFAPEIPK